MAFVKGNRPTNSDEVHRKSNSYRVYGQLSPITVAKGEDVLRSGGHLTDLDGKDIPDEQAQNYMLYWTDSTVNRLSSYLTLIWITS